MSTDYAIIMIMTNYRPITQQPLLSKAMEHVTMKHVTQEQLKDYREQYYITHHAQHGLRCKRSCC